MLKAKLYLAFIVLLLVFNFSFELKNLNQLKTNLKQSTSWARCSNVNGKCTFKGPQIVRFGNSAYFNYKEVTDSAVCNTATFGEVYSFRYKITDYRKFFCDVTNDEYVWVKCAGQYGKCNFPGRAIVQYGLNGKYKYDEKNGGVECSNGQFGDPFPGNSNKSCSYRQIIPKVVWTKCADNQGTCTVIGTQMVRYGTPGSYTWREATNSILCSNSIFNNPSSSAATTCESTNADYTWVKCADENGKCTFAGTKLVRLGAKEAFNYKESYQTVDCTNNVFGGDPTPGTPKACYYRLETVPIPVGKPMKIPDITNQKPVAKTTPLPQTVKYPKPKGVCEKAFGFGGKCLVQKGKLAYTLPDGVNGIWDSLFSPVVSKLASELNACVGDYSGSIISSDADLAQVGCKVPLESKATFGVLGFFVNGVICGSGSAQKLKGCMVFDDCGTVSVSINGGMAQCAANFVSASLSDVATPITKVIAQVAVGFSVQARFSQTFKIAFRQGTSVTSKSVTTRGHFNFGVGLSLPLDFIEVNKKSLKDFFDITANFQMMVDIGDPVEVPNIVLSLIPLILNPTSDNAQSALQPILKLGSEITLIGNGSLALKLGGLTNGFFPNISLELVNASILLSAGGVNAKSKMNTGIYMQLNSDVLGSLGKIIDKFSNQFGPIFSLMRIPKLTIPSGFSSSLGLFIQTDSVGFSVDITSGFTFKCIYIFANNSGGCQVDTSFFTAILEGAKWVVRQVAHFFDDAGKEILRFEKDAEKFAENAANEVAKQASQIADITAKQAQVVAKLVANEASMVASKVANEAEKAAGTVVNTATNVGNAIGGAASTAGNAIGGAATTAVNAVGNFFSGW